MADAFGLYLILTDPISGYERCARAAVAAGVRYLQLRMKTCTDEELRQTAARLREITRESATRLIINDSVAVGFGVDYVRHTGGPYGGPCVRWAPGPAGTNICVQTEGGDGSAETLIFPVVFQWNFWLSEAFSVFGEPGLALVHESVGGLDLAPFVLWGGGRYRFSDTVTLTGRIGFPSLSLGVSFLL